MLLDLLSSSGSLPLAATACIGAIVITAYYYYYYYHFLQQKRRRSSSDDDNPNKPVSVNFFFSRKCNKECGFCFHTEKTSYVASEADMQRGLRLLRAAGMRKINFAGGEPFLYPEKLAMLCRFCKQDLGLESVSIITNGTKVTRRWMEQHGRWVDVLGVSCDSFDERTNVAIGRGTGENVAQLFRIRGWCRELGIKFKLNTVVCAHNWREDMADTVARLDPFRWKVFQVLYVEGENDAGETDARSDRRKRDAKKLLITDEQYESFCEKHRHLPCCIPEPNSVMAASYLLLDEYLCFLDKGGGRSGGVRQSRSILDVGVEEAMGEVRWDREAFEKRGGVYEWSKEVLDEKEGGGGCGTGKGGLDW